MKKILTISFLLISVLVFGQKNIIRIENGNISGIRGKNPNVLVYKGIPYAAPPVNELRWKTPQPVTNWEGIRKCEAFSASAIQNKPVPFMMYTAEFLAPQEPLSEDCLYLNVWTAAKSSAEKRPVIVWIHGGAFTSGSGSVPLYDGENMAKKGAIFVTINYRLGIFGFLSHPDLTKESEYNASGNYAILDMIAALKWVKKNIAAFGGNPQNVTIAGQSAGAFGINVLMASPLAKGLFHRVIAESGGIFGLTRKTPSLAEAELVGVKLAEKMQANSIATLRIKPADELLKLNGAMNSPIIDGYVLTEQVHEIFEKNKQNDVPLLTGWNAGDRFPRQKVLNAIDFKIDAEKKYGELSNDFLKVYPANTDEEAKESQNAMDGDILFSWQNYTWAKLQSSKGKNKAFLYHFSHVPPQFSDKQDFGAFHSAEFGYALHTLHKWNRPFQASDKILEEQMSSYWVNFAKNGNPNAKGLPDWQAFDSTNPQVMEFGKTPIYSKLPSKEQLAFWDKYFMEQSNKNK
ncbi:Fumonisin B1 esterase [Emticicia aquatica]|uniref:Carboxylic ester hydrolase n=1 Tax=Emticicia aquatica TaxID=1681835 RepID=A0ABM9AS36_9BACT|nr:carboxylesterase family protein [Emticicia aquatica]CAH0996115.1 Fumonisin B1 esterase [Emticicia aquatica]